jgi:uncharacterized protein (TIGR00251 family)
LDVYLLGKNLKLLETARGIILEVYVKPKSKKFKVELDGVTVLVSCREAAVKGKVNQELLKQLSRLFNRQVQLVSGFTSRQKRFLISDIKAEEVNRILTSLPKTQQ